MRFLSAGREQMPEMPNFIWLSLGYAPEFVRLVINHALERV